MCIKYDYYVSFKKKENLLNMNRQQLRSFFSFLGEKSFRADQVMKWIYHFYCDDFDQMTNIKKSLRNKLKKFAEVRSPILINKYFSCDGTVKWCFQISDQQIETIYIPNNRRATLCISSQIGCELQCTFCSTGQQGFNRNLYVSEIVGQIWNVAKIIYFNKSSIINYPPITNIVIMGMGEPLLNFNNIITSIEIILDDFGFGLSKRRVTLSTAGVVPAIKKLADRMSISLAISLHAPNDYIRNKIMPINKKWNIRSLLTSIKYYLSKSCINYVTIEYVMLDHINDDISCAYQLVTCLKGISCKINLIPWNYIPNSMYRCSSTDRIIQFCDVLSKCGLIVTVRKTRGDDIYAACGQLIGIVVNKKTNLPSSLKEINIVKY